MSILIGIRHEDKYVMERRAPLTPTHIKRLITHQNLDFVVQSSKKRVFTNEEYVNAGALIDVNLSRCPVIFGVKEIPEPFFEANKTYIFFAHVAKGQKQNMPMLKRMMELKCNLIDYEKIVDEQNRRLIFFGRYAGLAGMINTLWSLGQRLKVMGKETAFLKLKQAVKYNSLAEAKDAVSMVGQEIAENGLPADLQPLVIGITGYGNVSLGAQEMLGLLPIKEISPEKLIQLRERKQLPNNLIYKVIFKEEHLSAHINSAEPFDLFNYYRQPENYHNVFEKYVEHLTALCNCIYWDTRFPRIVTKDLVKQIYTKGNPKLIVIGDITCDINGSIECTVKSTEIEDPVFVYNPKTDSIKMGFEGEGILDMAVDILPSELPRDSSFGFAEALYNFVKPIAHADYSLPYEEIDLPRAIKKALILHKGELTPSYQYIEKFLK